MPQQTLHYGLTCFTFGDAYSASADRKRFTIIDNQMWFLAEQIGDGIIDGWDVIQLDNQTVRVLPGMGIIDGFLTVTYGGLDVKLKENVLIYLYIQRIPSVIANIGPFCDPVSITYTDHTAPSTPSQPTLVSGTFDSITLEWTQNPEPDIGLYTIYRNMVAIDTTTQNIYVDTDLNQDTSYQYNIKATDVNGNTSGLSVQLLANTDFDSRIPTDPTQLNVLVGNQSLQVYWDASNFLANTYLITLQMVDTEGVNIGSNITANVSSETFYYIFSGLENGQIYQVTVQSVSYTGVTSPGISGKGVPSYSGGSTELTNIQIVDFPLDNVSYQVILHATWDLQNDEYAFPPDYYLVSVFQDGETPVASIYQGQDIFISGYTINSGGKQFVRDIEAETNYTILVQTVSGDVVSNGFIFRIHTRKFRPPNPVMNLTINAIYNISQRSLNITWDNGIGEFAYNTITVNRISLNVPEEYVSEETVILVDNLQYGQSISYNLPQLNVLNNCRYEVFITTFDVYGNSSPTATAVAVLATEFSSATVGGLTIINSGERPPVPRQQSCSNGDSQVTIYWNLPLTDFIGGYRIYRANYAPRLAPSSFTMIANLPASSLKYTDYFAENGGTYAYFVTTVDVFGNESLNPNDNWISYPFVLGEPRTHSDLSIAPTLFISADVNDVVLNWIPSEENFDGYEIYRSINNLYSFESVGFADASDSTYTDKNALLLNGVYYYMMREFRNEAQIIASNSQVAPISSLSIGVVSLSNDGISIDTSSQFSINLLSGPIKAIMKQALLQHTHLFHSTSDDRRIRLEDNLIVTDWTSTDYQTWTTQTSIVSTTTYIAYINGQQSTFNSVINIPNQTITFESAIYNPTNDPTGANVPVVMVIFLNVNETTGILPSANVENISGSKITQGIFSSDVIPQIDHLGRTNEALIPKQFPMTTVNPQSYSGTTPNGTTFYDVCKGGNNQLIVATSSGLLTPSTTGSGWTTLLFSPSPVTRVIYSQFLKRYFVATGSQVQTSTDLVNWSTISGMSGVNFVQELVEDGLGNVFASSDSGVFIVNPLQSVKLFWQQLPLFDSLNPNAYGMFYAGKLYVGGGSAIYSTYNNQTWIKESGSEISAPAHGITVNGAFIFAATSNEVWRKKLNGTTFESLVNFSVPCRQIVCFVNQLYVTTDSGLYTSVQGDIFNDASISFGVAFQNTSRNGTLPATHALRIFDTKLWMGMDNLLYSLTSNLGLSVNADITGTCPTIFVDGVQRDVGVFYSNSKSVMFDEQLDQSQSVSIVPSYTQFTALNGGWAQIKYDAPVVLTINGTELIGPNVIKVINGRSWQFPPLPWTAPTDPATVSQAMNEIVTPFFDGRSSDFTNAMASLTTVVKLVDSVRILTLNGATSVDSGLVAQIFVALDKFATYLNTNIRSLIKYPTLIGTITFNGITATFDVISGNVQIVNGVDKYDNISISIQGVSISNIGQLTHDEIETPIELLNSGLNASMAAVQQSNLVKAGIYLQLVEPYYLLDMGLTYQATFNVPCDNAPPWYNRLLSTIDYEEKVTQLPPQQTDGQYVSMGFSIDYPSDVLFVVANNEVWVCGGGGIISINVSTLQTRVVYSSEFYFYNMSLLDDTVYTLAQDGIYTVDINTGNVQKDVTDVPPSGYTSIYVTGNTLYVATNTGLFSKRPFEPNWTMIFALPNAIIRATQNLVFAAGNDPNSATNSLVYYSYGGSLWNRSTTFPDISINGLAQRLDTVYYATDVGLLVEDLSNLFSQGDQGLSSLSSAGLNPDATPLVINDVDADANRVIAGDSTGVWYDLNSGIVNNSGQSRLETIHKVLVVNGKYWLFADNLIDIEDTDRLVNLSTGKVLF